MASLALRVSLVSGGEQYTSILASFVEYAPMQTTARYFAVTATLLILVSPSFARDIFVSNTAGDDRFTGRISHSMPDLGGPVRTISKALRLAHRGDRIVVQNTGEAYRESLSLVGGRHSGNSHTPFIIQGNGAVLDGSAPVPPNAWEHYRGPVFRFRPARLEHQQLFLNDRPVPQVAANRLADHPPELEPLQWCLSGGHIYFCIEPMKMPEDYPLTCAKKPVGITLFHVDRVAIVDLTIQGFQLDGVNAHNSARRVSLTGLTCRGNGRAGISVGGASQVNVVACLVGNNGRAQLLTNPISETHVDNSTLLSMSAPAWVDTGGRVFVDDKEVFDGLEEIAAEEK